MKPRKPGQVVEEFEVAGRDGKRHHVVFRYPKMDDLNQALKYINALISEAEYIRLNKKLSRAEEKKWLSERIIGIGKKNAVTIFVFVDNEMAGSSSVERETGNESHMGDLGITLRENATGMGIGSRLMRMLESESKRIGIEILQLHCYGCNARAKHVYEKFGYKMVGFIPKGRKKHGRYDSAMIMYKDIGTR
jgi:RimJ/RimL family protein N-acetyltransferase